MTTIAPFCPDSLPWCSNHQLLNAGWHRHDLTEEGKANALVQETGTTGLVRTREKDVDLTVKASALRSPDGAHYARVWLSYGWLGSFEMDPDAAHALGQALISASTKVGAAPVEAVAA